MVRSIFGLAAILSILALFVGVSGCDSAPPKPKRDQKASAEPAPEPKTALPQAPGSIPYPPSLQKTLSAALQKQGEGYKPRTHHLRDDGTPRYTNRLILETSPYLLQHAHNPVDWRPWGADAFEEAQRLNRPVLLSVGYSTCHWCHVMEGESFEDEDIAAFINANFVPIKVDRERRPDVDSVYMTSVRLLTGGGGWPMTVVMTPAKEPFFAGTYFPARDGDRGARKGFLTILREINQEYREAPQEVVSRAKALSQRLQRASRPARPGDVPDASAIQSAAERMAQTFDTDWGGFRQRRKFPRPVALDFLLHYHRRTGDPEALWMVEWTLDRMASGGIRDHVGGGFHRYTVEPRWLVPHFEKMLYDNAQLAQIYLDAWQVTKEPLYRDIVRETLDYVDREMSHPEGGFYSATDADSLNPEGHMEEGWFFTWTPRELQRALSPREAQVLQVVHGTSARGNFEGRNILYLPRTLKQSASRLKTDLEEVQKTLHSAHQKLYDVRARRNPPLTDTKVLTAWNGLMISAFARAGAALQEPRYVQRAQRAASFLVQKALKKGKISRVYMDGRATHQGVLDDYAFLMAGLLDLFEATGAEVWLTHALDLQESLNAQFLDEKEGGFFFTSISGEKLLVREKPDYDGAEPAGNSLALLNLMRLWTFTGRAEFRTQVERSLAAFSRRLKQGGTALPKALTGLDFYLDTPKEIIVVKPSEEADESVLLREIHGAYLPHRGLVVTTENKTSTLKELVPWVEGKKAIKGAVTAYVCEEQVCKRPTSDPKVLARLLQDVTPYPLETRKLVPALPPREDLEDPERHRKWDAASRRWVRMIP